MRRSWLVAAVVVGVDVIAAAVLVARLTDDGCGPILQALASLVPDFQNLLNRIGDTVAVLQSASLFGDASAELERAFADAESCQQLQAEG